MARRTTRERIEARAYELYLQRDGAAGGDEQNDWLRAEQDIAAEDEREAGTTTHGREAARVASPDGVGKSRRAAGAR